MPQAAAAYFVSDAHFGAKPRNLEVEREARFHRFLASLPPGSSLYIVGDLFDFWFEYRTAIPRRHFATLAALRDVRAAGIEITYLNGNHDFWLGPFLSDDLGVRTHESPLTIELQGHRLWIHHGDGLIGDRRYRAFKRVIRHPASIALYRLLHPDLGIPLAHTASHWSRHAKGRRPLDGDRLWREIAAPRFAEGFDTVMIGHFHHAYERREDGRAFFVLGDWMEQFTYVTLREGRFALETFPPS